MAVGVDRQRRYRCRWLDGIHSGPDFPTGRSSMAAMALSKPIVRVVAAFICVRATILKTESGKVSIIFTEIVLSGEQSALD